MSISAFVVDLQQTSKFEDGEDGLYAALSKHAEFHQKVKYNSISVRRGPG